MKPFDLVAIHAKRVRELSAAGDWAGLVRYWMAHQHEPALDAAVVVARRCGKKGDFLQFLDAVRKHPIDFEREPSNALLEACDPEEVTTLFLLVLYTGMALCDPAVQDPPEQRGQLILSGLKAAKQACQVATNLRDRALHAFCLFAQARGHLEMRDLEEARRTASARRVSTAGPWTRRSRASSGPMWAGPSITWVSRCTTCAKSSKRSAASTKRCTCINRTQCDNLPPI